LFFLFDFYDVTQSFLDFQSPNGQLTYIAGEGLSIGGYFPAWGGIFQAQGSCPGDMKVSFSRKVSLCAQALLLMACSL
jgi:hypothetical protein